MKVKFGIAKKVITVAEMPSVKATIAMCREYDIMDYANIAAHAIENDQFEILKAEAEIAKNGRVWNYYSEDSGTIDVWIKIYAFNEHYGFFMIEAYLSDIETLPAKELRCMMYVREYKEANR